MFSRVLLLLLAACVALSATGFTLSSVSGGVRQSRGVQLFMGRAAAVRAKTKARTDGAKAKNSNRYAKKIIMAVKVHTYVSMY
jgi:hypothetical protein